MTQYSFTKIMGLLQDIYLEDPIHLPGIFWNTIDDLPNQEIFRWTERLLNKRDALLGNDYLTVVGIQHTYRRTETYTVKQKRRLVMELLPNWDYLTFMSELA